MRRAQQQLTRTRLLDAAAKLIAEKGYTATRIDEIANAAGATRATFYLHFAAKSELAHGFRDVLGSFDPDHRALLAVARAPSAAALSGWLAGYMEHVDRHPDYTVALRASWDVDPAARAGAEAIEARSTAALAAGLAEARGWPADHAQVVARILLRQLDITGAAWAREATAPERDDLRATIAAMWLTALIGPRQRR